ASAMANAARNRVCDRVRCVLGDARSEEHTSELQSRAQISYAVFCLKKKTVQATRVEVAFINADSTWIIDHCQPNEYYPSRVVFFFYRSDAIKYLHLSTHSFPSRRSSD